MILKIKTLDKFGWVLIDGFKKINFSTINTKKAKEMKDDVYTVINWELDDDAPAILITSCLRNDCYEYIAVFNTFGYILSDEGKTIERLN